MNEKPGPNARIAPPMCRNRRIAKTQSIRPPCSREISNDKGGIHVESAATIAAMTVTTRPPRVAPLPDAPVAPVRAPEAGDIGIGRARAFPPRREGPAKLTGQALYADDLVFPGAWYGHTIRSHEAHARLLGIDLDPTFDWSRVIVLTAKDIPGTNVVSLISDDQPVLVEDEIRHQAEPVALLAAPDRETLRAAKGRVRLRTEP